MTSKGDGLLRSNLPLGDTLLRGASYFVTVPMLCPSIHDVLAIYATGCIATCTRTFRTQVSYSSVVEICSVRSVCSVG